MAAGAAILFVILAVVTWQLLDQDAEPETAKAADPPPSSTPSAGKVKTAAKPAVKASDAGTPAVPAAKSAAPATAETKTKAPTFDVVRIAKDGSAVIAGRAKPGAEVKIAVEGKKIAAAKADKRGEWVMVIDKPLPPGATQLELSAKSGNEKEVAAESVLAVVVPVRKLTAKETAASTTGSGSPSTGRDQAVAILVPKSGDQVVKLLRKPRRGPARGVSVDSLDYGDQEEILIAGSAPAGARVRVYIDDTAAGDVRADDEGRWRMTPSRPVAAGSHFLRVDQLDENGKVVMRVELPFERMRRQALRALVAKRRVIVQPGNSLWRIARRVYGDGVRYTAIFDANAQTIRDPDMIFPGQVFDLPKTQ